MEEAGRFDRFATLVSQWAAQPHYFALCSLAVLVWALSGPIFNFGSGWQLIINTGTTIVTFLMVALLENTQARESKALQKKFDAVADGLADLMTHLANEHEPADLIKHIEALKEAVGLEERITVERPTSGPEN